MTLSCVCVYLCACTSMSVSLQIKLAILVVSDLMLYVLVWHRVICELVLVAHNLQSLSCVEAWPIILDYICNFDNGDYQLDR